MKNPISFYTKGDDFKFSFKVRKFDQLVKRDEDDQDEIQIHDALTNEENIPEDISSRLLVRMDIVPDKMADYLDWMNKKNNALLCRMSNISFHILSDLYGRRYIGVNAVYDAKWKTKTIVQDLEVQFVSSDKQVIETAYAGNLRWKKTYYIEFLSCTNQKHFAVAPLETDPSMYCKWIYLRGRAGGWTMC